MVVNQNKRARPVVDGTKHDIVVSRKSFELETIVVVYIVRAIETKMRFAYESY